jgi:AraC-like DNA-binding protein
LEIKFFKPKSEVLQKYIEGYYFLTNSKSDLPIEYYTFPNNYSIISIVENAEIIYLENQGIIKEKSGVNFNSDLICHYKKPIKLSYEGNINEITFYFKPLGINAFLNKTLNNYTSNFFSNFQPFDDYQDSFTSILKESEIQRKCEMIENYWLSKLVGFQHPFLKELLIDIHKEHSITELAQKYATSRQNLSKQFESHLCKSPSDFKKIQRFREALKSHMTNKAKNNLTTLSYDMLFYDQSHLIKDFKSLTGFTPKKFFKNISSHENGEVNWLFV